MTGGVLLKYHLLFVCVSFRCEQASSFCLGESHCQQVTLTCIRAGNLSLEEGAPSGDGSGFGVVGFGSGAGRDEG